MDPITTICVVGCALCVILTAYLNHDTIVSLRNDKKELKAENAELKEKLAECQAKLPTEVVDPLSQFEVVPLFENHFLMLNNLSLVLMGNVFIMCCFFAAYRISIISAYDYITRSVYFLVRSMAKENLYIKKQQYFAVLFYLFATLLLANLIGLLPYSFTVTSSFVLTLYLSLTHFIGVNLIGVSRHTWTINDLFLPSGAPLAIAPFLIFIEAVSYLARALSLSIRLFANMMSGHALLKILIGFSWTLLTSGSLMIFLSIFPWVIVTGVMFLELLIAFLQTYVFVILVTLYINDVLTFHD